MMILISSALALKNPTALSKRRVKRTKAWMIAGRESRRAGRGGRPREMEERERKTVV